MNYLSIDTSSDICSVTVALNGEINTIKKDNIREHSEHLSLFCKRLMGTTSYDAIDFIALSIGPGSYAGLKTSSSFVKGLSFAVHKPIVGIETFRGMNFSVVNKEKYYIALYSHRDYAYYQLYDHKGPLDNFICGKIKNMRTYKIYGYGFNNCKYDINYEEIKPSSKNIGMIAQEKYNNLPIQAADSVSPILLSMEK